MSAPARVSLREGTVLEDLTGSTTAPVGHGKGLWWTVAGLGCDEMFVLRRVDADGKAYRMRAVDLKRRWKLIKAGQGFEFQGFPEFWEGNIMVKPTCAAYDAAAGTGKSQCGQCRTAIVQASLFKLTAQEIAAARASAHALWLGKHTTI